MNTTRLLALPVIHLIVIAASACTGVPLSSNSLPSPSIEPTAMTMSAQAHTYLSNALDIIENNSIMRDKVDMKTLRRDALAVVPNAQTPTDSYPAILFALKGLGDNHSFFQTPEQSRLYASGGGKGLGIAFDSNHLIIIDVVPDSPAELAGIRVGDIVLTVNGKPVQEDALTQIRTAVLQEPIVRLTLRRSGQDKPVDISVVPGVYKQSFQPNVTPVDGSLGYINLPSFGNLDQNDSRNYANTVQQGIRDLDSKGVCGWIVDLEKNSGGNMYPMLAGVGPLLGDGDDGAFVDANSRQTPWGYRRGKTNGGGRIDVQVDPPYELKNPSAPVALLTGPITASSAEVILISFRGRLNARSFGEPTSGLTTANQNYTLSDGAVIYLATGLERDRTGQTYLNSIAPDELIKGDPTLIGTDQDPSRQAAIDWLHRQSACAAR